jgi:uncharacterized protein (TIGR03435 family)
MRRKLIPMFCIFAMTAAAASAQTAPQAPPKTAPPSAPSGPARNAAPSPEVQRLGAQISDYATTQCGGADADAATDCRIKALWAATQCPERMATASTESKTGSSNCTIHDPGFQYEVSSIKPHKNDGATRSSVGPTSDGYRGTNFTMINLVLNAYWNGEHIEVTGQPSWLQDLHFDVEAKFGPEVGEALMKLSRDDRGLVQRYMLLQLLKERMNFAAHVETKEVPSFDLVVAKNGPKVKVAEPSTSGVGSQMVPRLIHGRLVTDFTRTPMWVLASRLTGPDGRPVFDKTGLAGIYDFTLEYVREQDLTATMPGDSASGTPVVPPPDPAGPSLMSALEDQLGLKLVPSRGPIKIIVIDHIDKPNAN